MPVSVKELETRKGSLRERIVNMLTKHPGMAYAVPELVSVLNVGRSAIHSALAVAMDKHEVQRMRDGRTYRYYVKEA